jgi:hypothetical protein
MRPRKVKRGDKEYEMRARKNGSQTPAPGQAVSLPNEAPNTPPTDRLGIPLASETASQETAPATRPSPPPKDTLSEPRYPCGWCLRGILVLAKTYCYT